MDVCRYSLACVPGRCQYPLTLFLEVDTVDLVSRLFLSRSYGAPASTVCGNVSRSCLGPFEMLHRFQGRVRALFDLPLSIPVWHLCGSGTHRLLSSFFHIARRCVAACSTQQRVLWVCSSFVLSTVILAVCVVTGPVTMSAQRVLHHTKMCVSCDNNNIRCG